MKLSSLTAALVAVTLFGAPALAQQADTHNHNHAGEEQLAQQEVKRSITGIAPNLYRFQNNFHFSVFLVTDDGVIATDPINADAATWLEGEIKSRFNQEIKYLVLSHDHADHSAGGEVWADTATVVAHANARDVIIAEKRPTATPDLTFTDNMNITLGGQTVELSYVGRNHSDNMIVMNFPAQRALFAVDFIPVKTVAFRDFGDAYLPEWQESLRRVEAMDFDILVPGHGRLGTKADVAAFREYMDDLWAAVKDAVRAGKTVEQAQAEIKLDKYADWAQFEAWGPLNIAGAHRIFSQHRRGN
ncbi:MAG: MBL fold metallo-hydrolase [Alphaproteobacteria bacterium]|nr:MBL fold metallo-hydrolase [Alphaproteobacteria bacterium]